MQVHAFLKAFDNTKLTDEWNEYKMFKFIIYYSKYTITITITKILI